LHASADVASKISSESFQSLFYGFFRRKVRFNGNQAQIVGRMARRLEMNTAAPLSHKFIARESMPLFEFGNPVSNQKAKISYGASDVRVGWKDASGVQPNPLAEFPDDMSRCQ
jgi:hypothetical protein